MLDPLDVIIPTALGGARGRVGLAAGAASSPEAAGAAGTEAGVVLLDESAGHPEVERVFTELGAYLQAAGMLVVRAASSERTPARIERLCTIVGAVALARTLGARRLAVCVATSETSPGGPARQTTLAGMVGLAARGARDGAQLAAAIAEVTAAIRDAADCIAASATLLVPSVRPRPALRDMASGTPPPLLPDLPDARHRVVTLPRPQSAARDLTPVISALYTWARALRDDAAGAHAGQDARAADGDDATMPARPVSGPLLWLEGQWQAIVATFEQRDPAGAAPVRAADRAADGQAGFHALRAAHAAWPTLDAQARLAWLRACSRGFSFVGLAAEARAADGALARAALAPEASGRRDTDDEAGDRTG